MAHIKPFKAAIPILDLISDTDGFFEIVKETFPEVWQKGLYKPIEQNAFYIYQQKTDVTVLTGVIATVEIKDYLEGNIVRHENTLAAKRNQMLDLFYQREAHIKPALLTYKADPKIKDLILKCKRDLPVLYTLNFKNANHTFWQVSDSKIIDEFVELFRNEVSKSYIADGHHRTEAAAILYRKILKLHGDQSNGKPYQRILSAFYSSDQLEIHEFNRVVRTLNHYSEKGFKAELRKHFIIDKQFLPFQPTTKNEIGMYISKKWYRLVPKESLRKENESLVERLDVSLLNRLILKQILEIKDIRNDPRIIHVEGPKGLRALEKKVGKSHDAVAFSLFPITIQELMDIADANETMPPKSTYFEPRMRNGLIVSHFSKLI